MKSLFTIHCGELLVASHIERHFKRVNIWIPSRDTGIDLLLTDIQSRQATSLQVKYSRDFLVTHKGPEFQEQVRASGWWTIDRDKLRTSKADYWVFVLQGFANRTTDFVLVRPRELLRRLQAIHGSQKRIQSYLWSTKSGQCWETRGLKHNNLLHVANATYRAPDRNFTQWLNNWGPVEKLNR